MKQGEIWSLENYKVEKPNRYSEVIDKEVCFDYRNRERAIEDLFNSTTDSDVKQVLIYAMELNNKYRSEAMELYHAICFNNEALKQILKTTESAELFTYL